MEAPYSFGWWFTGPYNPKDPPKRVGSYAQNQWLGGGWWWWSNEVGVVPRSALVDGGLYHPTPRRPPLESVHQLPAHGRVPRRNQRRLLRRARRNGEAGAIMESLLAQGLRA